MKKEKESIFVRVLMWPLFSMGKSIDKIHVEMDEMKPDDPFLGEDKRSIGIAGAFSGCILTLLWWGLLFVLLIIALVLLLNRL